LSAYGDKTVNRFNQREVKLIQFLSQNLDFKQLETLIELFNEQYYQIDRNVNARIQYFYVFIEFTKLVKRKQVVQ